MARHYGVSVVRIDLRCFGGVVQFGSRPIGPWRDFALTYAGPASNLALALICGLLLLPLLDPHMVRNGCEFIQGGYHPLGLAGDTLVVALYVNLGQALANLLLGRPLDGGWITYDQLRQRAGQRQAGVMISILTLAQGMTGLSLLFAVLIIGIPS